MPTFAFLLPPRTLTDSLRQGRMLPYLLLFEQNQSFGVVFDARLFSAQKRSTSELLRTL